MLYRYIGIDETANIQLIEMKIKIRRVRLVLNIEHNAKYKKIGINTLGNLAMNNNFYLINGKISELRTLEKT